VRTLYIVFYLLTHLLPGLKLIVSVEDVYKLLINVILQVPAVSGTVTESRRSVKRYAAKVN